MIEQIATVVSGLKGAPALLAVVLLQIATMGLVYFVADNNADRQQAWDMAMIERCFQTDSIPKGEQ